jgi:hypothetical protein
MVWKDRYVRGWEFEVVVAGYLSVIRRPCHANPTRVKQESEHLLCYTSFAADPVLGYVPV